MKYRSEIDGLRAIAVVAVVVFHAHFMVFGAPLLPGGFLGVDVFFAISGYIITRLILGDLSKGTFSISHFYARRARRILPALAAVLVTSLATGLLILTPQGMTELSASLLSAVAFVANFYFYATTGYFSEAGELVPLLHLWSLAVEEQFYLVYPLALVFVLGRRMTADLATGLAALAGLSLLAALFFQGRSPDDVFYISVYRIWELLAGALVALWHDRRPAGRGLPEAPALLGVAILAFAIVMPIQAGRLSYLSNVMAVAGAALILAFGEESPWLKAVLSARPVVFVGVISYSLYLWHQPVFAFARLYAINELGTVEKTGLLGLSFALAILSWRFIETPFRTARRGSLRKMGGSLFPIFAIVAVTALAGIATKGFPARFSAAERELLSVSAERGTLVLKGQDCKTASLEKICIIGDRSRKPTWALLGDSHAETLADSLSAYLAGQGLAGEVLTYPACPFILGVDPVYTHEACASFTAGVLAELGTQSISTVVINDRSTAYMIGTRFDNGEGGVEPGAPFPVAPAGTSLLGTGRVDAVATRLSNTIETLLSRGIRVIYIAPVPEVGWHVPRTALRLVGRGRLSLTTSRAVYLKRHERVLSIMHRFAKRPNFLPIYTHDLLCSEATGRCGTHSENRLFYTDTDHLSRDGAAIVIARLAELVGDAGTRPAESQTTP